MKQKKSAETEVGVCEKVTLYWEKMHDLVTVALTIVYSQLQKSRCLWRERRRKWKKPSTVCYI